MGTIELTVVLDEDVAEYFHNTLGPLESPADRVAQLVGDDVLRRAARQLAADGWHDDPGVLEAACEE